MKTQIILSQTNKGYAYLNKDANNNYKETTMKYFLFKVKMGHVGKTKYLPMIIPIRATSLDEAVAKANNHGGVKRDHKDWCLEIPREISYEEYKNIGKETYSDPYWNGETRRNLSLFADRLVDEPLQVEKETEVKTKQYNKIIHTRKQKTQHDYLNDYYDEMEEIYDEYYV